MTQTMKKIAGCATIAAAALAMASAAHASVIISNLNGDDGTQSAGLDDSRNKAMGFTMGSDAYFLDSVTMRLETFGAGASPIVQIWSDVAGLPSASLITLSNPAIAASGMANYDFTPGGQFTLQANTTYWLIAYGPAGVPTYDWKADGAGIVPTGIATHAGALFGVSGAPPTSNSGILNSYAITATLVPAPASAAMLGLAGLIGARRRR